ncbi:hypothetical protein M2139_000523 [Enterococcus sp. PF1-24]|uniref:plantaricin C family lantibiotic n=1 Tax=unclassified Enterococcus TaxID=2608891 RepID=UPI00247593B6|nr:MULTISPECIES: plantaricin C family lantibiotic [unclassified Enterococcus]MDH6363686.1 hypothetical protein [Enterococcus sp. PFB1-1]MDH6400642.1 hypothetical protein [Enterococcus sp. PF1-24]
MNTKKYERNPVIRFKKNLKDDISAGVILEEITDQNMNQNAGGTLDLTNSLCGIYFSKKWGNQGYFCSVTKECSAACQLW